MILRHPAFIGQHHVHAGPVEVSGTEVIKDWPRRGPARHRHQHAVFMLQRGGQLARDLVGQVDGQHLLIGICHDIHHLISRHLRPSRCISISASSGPLDPLS